MDQIDLSDFFKTKAQAVDFSARLAIVGEKIYQTGFSLEQTLLDQFGIQKKDKFLTLLRDNSVAVESNTDLKAFLDKLQETIAATQVLTMRVAFEPKEQTLKALSEWFLINIKRQLLLDITVDQNIIGGAVIGFNGKHLDYSLKPKLEQIIVATQDDTSTPAQEEKPIIPSPHGGSA